MFNIFFLFISFQNDAHQFSNGFTPTTSRTLVSNSQSTAEELSSIPLQSDKESINPGSYSPPSSNSSNSCINGEINSNLIHKTPDEFSNSENNKDSSVTSLFDEDSGLENGPPYFQGFMSCSSPFQSEQNHKEVESVVGRNNSKKLNSSLVVENVREINMPLTDRQNIDWTDVFGDKGSFVSHFIMCRSRITTKNINFNTFYFFLFRV